MRLVSAMNSAAVRYLWVVGACVANVVVLWAAGDLTLGAGLGLGTDVLNHLALAALVHTGAGHFRAIVTDTGSDIERLLMGVAHISDLYQQLAAVWLAAAIIGFTRSAADWPAASTLVSALAAVTAASRVLDIWGFSGPVVAEKPWAAALLFPVRVLRSNFQLLTDDRCDLSALAAKIKRERTLHAARTLSRDAEGGGEEFADAREEEELTADDLSCVKEFLSAASARHEEFEFTKQQEKFFKELLTSLKRAESAISLLGLAAMLDVAIKALRADAAALLPALLDVRAWHLMGGLITSLHSQFVAIIETEGSDITVLMHAVGDAESRGMTLTKQFRGLRVGGQIVTVGKLIGMAPPLLAATGLSLGGALSSAVSAVPGLRGLLLVVEGTGAWGTLTTWLLVLKRVLNTFAGAEF